MGTIIDYMIYLSLLMISAFCFTNYKRISRCIVLLVATYAFLMFTTIMNGASGSEIIAVIKHSLKVILVCLLVECLIYKKKELDLFLYAVRDITLALFLVNILATMIYPHGIPSITNNAANPYFIFGNVNSVIRMVLPGMCCASIIDYRKGRRVSLTMLIYVFGFLYTCFFIYFTATTFVAVTIIFLWLCLSKILMPRTMNVYFVVACAVAVLEVLIVFLTSDYVITFIAGLLNKGSDFSGRLVLWGNALEQITKSPIIGYGRQSLSEIQRTIGLTTGSHNYFLDILYQRGIIGFCLLMILIVMPVSSKKKRKKAVSKEIYVLVGYSISLLLMFLSEPFFEFEYCFMPVFYLVFVLRRNQFRRTRRKYDYKKNIATISDSFL